MLFFQLPTWLLGLIVLAVNLAATVIGMAIGRSARERSELLREPFSVMQAVLLGFMSLVLAFGLSLAVGRYQDRRAATVDEETRSARPICEHRLSTSRCAARRSDCCAMHEHQHPYLSDPPGQFRAAAGNRYSSRLQRQLWNLAGQSLNQAPTDSAPRHYVESLNETFDSEETRVSSLGNRVPTAVLVLELAVAAVGAGLICACTRGPWAAACSRSSLQRCLSPRHCSSPSTRLADTRSHQRAPWLNSTWFEPAWSCPRQRRRRPIGSAAGATDRDEL